MNETRSADSPPDTEPAPKPPEAETLTWQQCREASLPDDLRPLALIDVPAECARLQHVLNALSAVGSAEHVIAYAAASSVARLEDLRKLRHYIDRQISRAEQAAGSGGKP